MFIFGEWAGSWPGVPDPAHYRTDSLSSEASAAHWSKEKGITKARRSRRQERAGGPKTANKEDGFPKSVSPGPRVTPDPLLSQEEKWSAHDPDLSDKMPRGNIHTHKHTTQTHLKTHKYTYIYTPTYIWHARTHTHAHTPRVNAAQITAEEVSAFTCFMKWMKDSFASSFSSSSSLLFPYSLQNSLMFLYTGASGHIIK